MNMRYGQNKTENLCGRKDIFDITSGKELLVALLIVGGVFTVLSIEPVLLAAAMPFAREYRNTPKDRRRFQKTFSYLRQKKYVTVQSRKGQAEISLTEHGKKRARVNYFSTEASLPIKERKWDKVWRLIMFDIPVGEQLKRDAFRHMVKRLGAVMFQQSVWIYPYNCSEQVSFLSRYFDLPQDNLRLVVSSDIGDDSALRKHFGI
ncbi:MAG: hypothetical protein Q7S05_04260 [bacterium]|nr:hypothetical protein [bacterium]